MRVVLDTNVVVSALVFQRGSLSALRDLWKTRAILPLVCRETSQELIRVLAYPKFGLGEAEIEVLLADLLPYAEVVRLPSRRPRGLVRCRDADDDAFIRLAAAGKADVLVTGDRDLLALRGRVVFAIETPANLLRRLR